LDGKIITTPLDIIRVPGGDVMHAIKKSDTGFNEFGEAYFSMIEFGLVKAWKRHKEMTLNLVVPAGEIKFVLFDDREAQDKKFKEVVISRNNYCRLTVPPMIWLGFQGLDEKGSILLNIADIEHDPSEVDRKNNEEIEFNWSKV